MRRKATTCNDLKNTFVHVAPLSIYMYRDLSHVWPSHQMANCLSVEVKLKQLIYRYYYYGHVYNQWQSSVAKCSNVYCVI